ncbi:hypothetical protein MP228_008940 [Amoeboaphelidium protococcarum]|nr:hypothetical protein MP228_008940 [Amoeboaphelidium protococcarum]
MKSVLVYGGNGALGQAICKIFKAQKWSVISVDFRSNNEVDHNIVLDVSQSWDQHHDVVLKDLSQSWKDKKLSAVVCVAGGWAGGNLNNASELLKNVDLMYKQSVQSSVLVSLIAAKYLEEKGLVVLTGAKAALGGTGGMLAYGLAKAAVHQLTKSLSDPASSGLPSGATTVALLPVTLDTKANRSAMPGADTSSWTPLDVFGEKIAEYAGDATKRPQSGSLVEVVTASNQTQFNVLN